VKVVVSPFATFEKVEIIENGEAIAILLREKDGTISAIRISVDQLAD